MVENTGTIDYGIDLGTTTSSVAKVEGNSAMVIPNAIDNKNFTSSAVYINKKGKKFIGDKAKTKIGIDPDNGFSEFKLRMGSDDVYEFKATGQKTTPVELSAEILKNLKQSVYEKNQKDLKAAVITVPADFTTPQTKATTEAAKLAGFEEVILLQEPTAAAMAYGMGSSKENEIWLIYDFGGGTFDLSIMKKDQEGIQNINNDGDAYLGGKLIDFDIVDKIFVPAILEEIDLENFNRNNKKYIKQFAKLKIAAETAKTELSNDDTAEVFIENFVLGDDGDMYDFEYEMTRSQLDEVMKPYVDRTINHCHRALEDVNLSISDVTKIILVGGSTLSPYIHKRLTDEFGIPLEYSIDPTTVVARGAAVFAGTKQYVERKGTTDQVSIELKYKTIGDDIEFNVQGVLNVPGGSPEDYSVEFINNKTRYASGKITVDNGGFFMTSLLAESEDEENTYQIKVYDQTGSVVELSPNSINTVKYKIDIPPAENKLSHTLGLGLFGNELDPIAERNTPLPYDYRGNYKTSNDVHPGNASEKVYLPLYEGNNMKADRNTYIGCLEITGADVNRTLPAGQEIELTVSIDESMNIETNVYIPFLDQEFDNAIIIRPKIPGKHELEVKFEEQQQRYHRLKSDPACIGDPNITSYFNQITNEQMIENIITFLETSETDEAALDNASKRINDFTNILDIIEEIVTHKKGWDELKVEVDQLIMEIDKKIHTKPEILNYYSQIKDMYNNAIEEHNSTLLATVKDRLEQIFAELHRKEIVKFTFLELSTSGQFIDQNVANNLIAQGNAALSRGDYDELERIASQLYRIQKQDIYVHSTPPGRQTPTPRDYGVKRKQG